MDVPHRHPARRAVTVSQEGSDRVRVAYDAAAFANSRSGEVEIRIRTHRAAEIVALLTAG